MSKYMVSLLQKNDSKMSVNTLTKSTNNGYSGFTIVELLVVIVVIGILAAITIVSYSGVTTRANIASIESDLSNNSKILKMYSAEHGGYPSALDSNNCPTLPEISTKYCLKFSSGNTFNYSGSGANYSLSVARNSLAYYTTSDIAISVVTPPTLINNTVASITTTSAILGGTVATNGGSPVTNYGVCYGLTPNPTSCTEIEQGSLSVATPATAAAATAQKKLSITTDGLNAYTVMSNGAIGMYSRNTTTNALNALTPSSIVTGDSSGMGLVTSPDGKFVYAFSSNLSSSKEIYMFSRNETNGLLTALTPNKLFVWSGGAGCEEMEISKDGKHIYVCLNGDIYTYSRNETTGLLTMVGSKIGISLGNEIALSPDDLYLYAASVDASNQGRILAYTRNASTGALTYSSVFNLGNNMNPKTIAISSDGKSLYSNLPANNIIRQFSRNTSNGQIAALSPISINGAIVTGLELSKDDKTLYASGSGVIRMYSRDTTTGLLSAMTIPTISETSTDDLYIAPDDKALYSVNSAANIRIFNRSSGAAEGTAFTKPITGLTTGTTYYYRTFSTNSAGTSYSADSTFTTL